MTFDIKGNTYDVKFTFRLCRILKKEIGKITLEGEEMIDVVYEKGAKLIHTAIKENKLSPIPSIKEIEDSFDDNLGMGVDFLIEAVQEIGAHITPTRVEELEDAAKGN